MILHIEENIEQINIQDSYLMMRCTNDMGKVTLGLWLREEDDRIRLFQALTRLKGSRHSSPVDMSHMLTKLMSAANKGVSPSTEPHNGKKGAQLLSILKQPDTSTTPADEFPSSSGQAVSTKSSALLSLLRGGPSPLPSTADCSSSEEAETLPAATTHPSSTQPSTLKKQNTEAANKLLSLIKSPPRPISNGSGDLLTDGDIAAKVRTRAVSEGSSSSASASSSSVVTVAAVAATNVAALKAALFVGNSTNTVSNAVNSSSTSSSATAVVSVIAEKKPVSVVIEQKEKAQVRTAPTTPVLSAVSSAGSSEASWAAMNALPPSAAASSMAGSSGKMRQQVKLISPSDLEAY